MSRAAILLFLFAIAAPLAAQGPPKGTWLTKDKKQFVAELIAADGWRATFQPADKPKFVLAYTELDPEDADSIRSWRATYFRTPLVDPTLLSKWPNQAAAEKFDVRASGEEGGIFSYESPTFHFMSDLRLPLSAVRDIATVLEATRAVLIAIPLGLHAGGEQAKYSVLMYGTPEAYAAAGGPTGSGGYYDGRGRRMLVLLPNFGIEQKGGVVRLNYSSNYFVLKHEVTHQLLARWHGQLPMWLSEGIAEFIASIPYSAGRYNLQKPGAGLHDYILKWRKSPDNRVVTVVPTKDLMALEERGWRKAVAQGAAYDLYNSAALLTWYFIQEDGGTRFAAYLDALRRGDDKAESLLLKGRKTEVVDEDLAAMAKKMGLIEKKDPNAKKR